jgi:hypothetical protein
MMLTIVVELRIDNPSIQLTKTEAFQIKEEVEQRLKNPALAQYLHSLGSFLDQEVVKVVHTIEHDTRQ